MNLKKITVEQYKNLNDPSDTNQRVVKFEFEDGKYWCGVFALGSCDTKSVSRVLQDMATSIEQLDD
jgi:hypothetical protein